MFSDFAPAPISTRIPLRVLAGYFLMPIDQKEERLFFRVVVSDFSYLADNYATTISPMSDAHPETVLSSARNSVLRGNGRPK